MSHASLMVCLHYQTPRPILGPRLMKWLKVANGISDRVSVQCENLYTILCNDAARSLPNQLENRSQGDPPATNNLVTVAVANAVCNRTVHNLCIKSDVAAILESRRSRCM